MRSFPKQLAASAVLLGLLAAGAALPATAASPSSACQRPLPMPWATVAVESGGSVPITWVTSNPGVATVDTNGVVTAVADGEAKITALSPSGRYAVCSVVVGLAGDKYDTEEDLADELKLPDPYVAVRLNRLS